MVWSSSAMGSVWFQRRWVFLVFMEYFFTEGGPISTPASKTSYRSSTPLAQRGAFDPQSSAGGNIHQCPENSLPAALSGDSYLLHSRGLCGQRQRCRCRHHDGDGRARIRAAEV